MMIPGILAQRRHGGGTPFAVSPSQSILDSLMAWWDFEENNTSVDFLNRLSPRRSLRIEGSSNTGLRSTASGKIGRAMETDAANESAALNTGVFDFNFANQSFTIFEWHYRGGGSVPSLNTQRYIGGRRVSTGDQRSFNLAIRGNGSGQDYAVDLSSDGTSATSTSLIGTPYDLSTGGWDFVAYGYDAAAELAFLIVNGVRVTAAHTGGVFRASTARFGFGGSIADTGVSSFAQFGRHDSAGVLGHAITNDEYAVLYNAGAGLSFGSLAAAAGLPYVAGRSDTLFTTATSQSAAIPPTTTTGDLLVACVMHRSTLTPPSGWTLLDSVAFTSTGATQISAVYTRVAEAGSAGASTTWAQAASGRLSVTILDVKKAGSSPAVIGTATAFVSEIGTNESAIAGINSTAPGQLLLACSTTVLTATSGLNSIDVSAGWQQDTPAVSGDTSNQIRAAVAHRRVITPGVESGVFTQNTTSTTNGWGSVTLLIE